MTAKSKKPQGAIEKMAEQTRKTRIAATKAAATHAAKTQAVQLGLHERKAGPASVQQFCGHGTE